MAIVLSLEIVLPLDMLVNKRWSLNLVLHLNNMVAFEYHVIYKYYLNIGLNSIHVCPLFHTPFILRDNLSSTYLAMNPISHSHIKYEDIDFPLCIIEYFNKSLDVKFVSLTHPLVDAITKPLPTQILRSLSQTLSSSKTLSL